MSASSKSASPPASATSLSISSSLLAAPPAGAPLPGDLCCPFPGAVDFDALKLLCLLDPLRPSSSRDVGRLSPEGSGLPSRLGTQLFPWPASAPGLPLPRVPGRPSCSAPPPRGAPPPRELGLSGPPTSGSRVPCRMLSRLLRVPGLPLPPSPPAPGPPRELGLALGSISPAGLPGREKFSRLIGPAAGVGIRTPLEPGLVLLSLAAEPEEDLGILVRGGLSTGWALRTGWSAA
mmetsp:Transcript_23769/g.65940  ORF Transcript_23769/g.65940 Transcript_23769/m.65940 type:complete len:234 (-) Transcript_23769:26-727(-)